MDPLFIHFNEEEAELMEVERAVKGSGLWVGWICGNNGGGRVGLFSEDSTRSRYGIKPDDEHASWWRTMAGFLYHTGEEGDGSLHHLHIYFTRDVSELTYWKLTLEELQEHIRRSHMIAKLMGWGLTLVEPDDG